MRKRCRDEVNHENTTTWYPHLPKLLSDDFLFIMTKLRLILSSPSDRGSVRRKKAKVCQEDKKYPIELSSPSLGFAYQMLGIPQIVVNKA